MLASSGTVRWRRLFVDLISLVRREVDFVIRIERCSVSRSRHCRARISASRGYKVHRERDDSTPNQRHVLARDELEKLARVEELLADFVAAGEWRRAETS